MHMLDHILPLFMDDGGIILRLAYFRKPLWFSDAHLAVCFSNQYSGAAMIMAREMEMPTTVETRMKSTPASSAAKSAGLGFTVEQAVYRAVGEAIERFCGFFVQRDKHKFRLGSYKELKPEHPVVDPEALNTTDRVLNGVATKDGVFRIYRLTHDARIRWLSVTETATKEVAWVPAMAGFLGTEPISLAEQYLEQTSGGLSCHASVEAAVLGGVCELVERDAFTAMWLLRCQPFSVRLDDAANASAELQRMVKELADTAFEVFIHDLTSDLEIPVYLVTLLNDAKPYTIVGAGCHPDPAVALEKAFREVLMSVANLGIYADADLPTGALASEEDIRSMHDHSRFYAVHDLRSRLDFYLRDNESRPVRMNLHQGSTEAQLLPWCLQKLRANGLRVFHNDLTVPEVGRCGLHVAKVIIPGLLPLHCFEHNKPVGSTRLSDYSSGAIFRRAVSFEQEINPWSHPFP